MSIFIFLSAFLLIFVTGCSSSSVSENEQRNLHITMDVNINEAAPAPPVQPAKTSRRTVRKDTPAPQRKAAAQRNNTPVMDRLVPPATGAFDSELNDVERSYLQDIRRRREQSVRASEDKIFGSFSPSGLFKSKK